jgi:broad specificity phosphatase PhoE
VQQRALTSARRPALAALALICLVACSPEALAQADPWQLLRQPGLAVFLRHSDAPGSGGVGDPPGFSLEDCTTQRNLSEEGRAHARRTGEALRVNGVAFDRILSSPWCRCMDTARLALGKEAEPFAPLSNLVGRGEHRASQVAALKAYLGELEPRLRVLFVTHGVLINALTGIQPAMGEMVIVRTGPADTALVAGRLKVD